MQIFRSPFVSAPSGSVLAIGNFDGVHLGHRAVLAETTRIAHTLGAPASVLTFTPHPREFFQPKSAPLRIYPLHTKCALLKECGVETLFLQRFSSAFSRMSAEAFIQELLHARLRVKHVVTGENFIFGQGRQGNAAMLAAHAKPLGFGYTAVSLAACEGQQDISSSRVRHLLAEGDISAASALLGAPYRFDGRVVQGEARGRTLGFPTANITLANQFCPAYGVYAVKVRLPGGEERNGVANYGIRPTFGGSVPRLEVHVFDFEGDLYGARLCVEPVAFLRGERKFESLAALTAQISADAAQARALVHG